jgi:hypothetical protein
VKLGCGAVLQRTPSAERLQCDMCLCPGGNRCKVASFLKAASVLHIFKSKMVGKCVQLVCVGRSQHVSALPEVVFR